MIAVDSRAGSAQFGPLLRRLGLQVEMTQLPFGDVAFDGLLSDGSPTSYGLELKSVSDVVACVQSGRFAGHQLPGLMSSFDNVWLLIYGQWRARVPDGVLEELRDGRGGGKYWYPAGGGQRLWMHRDLESWLITMQIAGGIRVHRVRDAEEAAVWIRTLYNWSQRSEHKSHRVIYQGKHLWQDTALLSKPTLATRVAAELPMVSVKRAPEVVRTFKSVHVSVSQFLHTIADAEPKDWARVPGIGRGIGKKIYDALHCSNGSGK